MENKHLAFRRVRARENLTAQRNKKMGGSSQKQKQKPNLLYFLLILELWCVAWRVRGFFREEATRAPRVARATQGLWARDGNRE